MRSDPPEGAADDGAPDRSPADRGQSDAAGPPDAAGAASPRTTGAGRAPAARSVDLAPAERVLAVSLDGAATAPAAALAPAAPEPEPAPEPIRVPPVVEVDALDWDAVRRAVDPDAVRARLAGTLDRVEALLDRDGGPGFLFDDDRATPDDQAIRVRAERDDDARPLWFVGDLHGDLLALEAALALARAPSGGGADAGDGGDTPAAAPRLVFLGDLFDDGGYGLEVLARVFELLADDPGSACVLAGNHDEALAWTGERFASRVSPSDFADYLNARLDDADVVRAGRLAVRLFARAPRALFFPDGLLAAHAGFPLVDLHADLAASGDFNDPRALTDFAWVRLHPKARRKLPNRASRGSQFGREDFDDFCALAARLGRPVTHLVRGHDHVEERWEVPAAYAAHPVLTTVALARRTPREVFGPYARVPTVARYVPGALPQVHRLHVPEPIVRDVYPEEDAGAATDAEADA